MTDTEKRNVFLRKCDYLTIWCSYINYLILEFQRNQEPDVLRYGQSITLKKYKEHPNLAPGTLAIGLANSVIIDSQLCPHSICGWHSGFVCWCKSSSLWIFCTPNLQETGKINLAVNTIFSTVTPPLIDWLL